MKRSWLGVMGAIALLGLMALTDAQAGDTRCRRGCHKISARCRKHHKQCATACPQCNPLSYHPAAVSLPHSVSTNNAEEGFKVIFDGKSLDGWKSSTEHPESWKLVDGALVANGERSHMFYVGDEKPFENFELKVDCMTKKGSNGGIYIRTKYQEVGWPKYGHEAQVNNSQSDPKRSGSLYGIVDVLDKNIPDDTWWTETVTVVGKHITIKLNDKVVVDYEEPADKQPYSKDFERRLGEGGTFALQAHDPGSTIYYKNIRVKRLP